MEHSASPEVGKHARPPGCSVFGKQSLRRHRRGQEREAGWPEASVYRQRGSHRGPATGRGSWGWARGAEAGAAAEAEDGVGGP